MVHTITIELLISNLWGRQCYLINANISSATIPVMKRSNEFEKNDPGRVRNGDAVDSNARDRDTIDGNTIDKATDRDTTEKNANISGRLPDNLDNSSSNSTSISSYMPSEDNAEDSLELGAMGLVRSVTEDVENKLRVTPSRQEIETEEEVKPLQKPKFSWARQIVNIEEAPYSRRYNVLSQVVCGTILGVMGRIGLITLSRYKGAYINYHPGTCLWCNFTSCFVLGLCNNFFTFWSHALKGSGKKNMKQFALHTGITVGFCGALSTWGALLVEVTFKTIDIVNGGNSLPSHGYGALEFFSVFIVQMATCVTDYLLGKDLAGLLDIWQTTKYVFHFWNYRNVKRVEHLCTVLGTVGFIANLILACTLPMSNWYKQKYAISILMGVPAALLRFYFSKFNGIQPVTWFPLGTFISNICSTTLMAVLNLLFYGYKDEATRTMLIVKPTKRIVLKSLTLGFCGCLSSIASVMNELYCMKHPVQRYVYFFSTFISCWIPLFIIDCCYSWVKGFNPDYHMMKVQ